MNHETPFASWLGGNMNQVIDPPSADFVLVLEGF